MYEAELNLEVNLLICDCQVNELSAVSPKNVIVLEFSIYLSSYFIKAWVVSMCLVENCIKFVLLKFNVNKLACNHLLIL